MKLPLARPQRLLLLALLAALLAHAGAGGARAGETDLASIRRLLEDPSPRTRAAAVRRLAGREDRGAVRLVVGALDDPHPYPRRAAAGVLGAVPADQIRGLGRELDRLRSPRARAASARVAALWGGDAGRTLLLGLLRDREAAVRTAAVRWLEADADEEAGAALERALDDRDGGVRALALDALRGRAGARPPPPARLADPDPRVRLSALESSVALGSPSAGGEAAVVAVLRGLDDAVWSVRLRAAELAGTVRHRRVLAALVPVLEDERARVREAAHGALVALTGIPFDPEPAVWRGWLEGDGQGFDPQASDPPERPPRHGGTRTVARARFLDLPLSSRHVAFVLDGSGSMARRDAEGTTRWTRIRRALARALAELGDAEVNVIRFADEAAAVFPEARALTAARRSRIERWLEEAEPRGRTALYDGVALALADPSVDTVVLLTDGAPSAGRFFTRTELVAEVARANRWRRARLDVLHAEGDGVAHRWRAALRRLAEDSGGRYRQL